MRISMRQMALAAGAVITVTAAGVAMAQPPVPPSPPTPPMGMMHGEHGMHRDPAAHAQHLRDVLQLRADQEGALKAYLDATAPKMAMESMKHGDDDNDDKALTTPERLDRQAAHMAKMAEAFQKRAAATRAFYAALSPSQQKAFDALGPRAGGPHVMIHSMKMGQADKPAEGERRIIMKRSGN